MSKPGLQFFSESGSHPWEVSVSTGRRGPVPEGFLNSPALGVGPGGSYGILIDPGYFSMHSACGVLFLRPVAWEGFGTS